MSWSADRLTPYFIFFLIKTETTASESLGLPGHQLDYSYSSANLFSRKL